MNKHLEQLVVAIIAVLVIVLACPTAHADCTLPGMAVCDGVACAGKTYSTGQMVYNADHGVMQVCNADGSWSAMGKVLHAGCPTIGDTCSDGTYYIGDIGGNKIYAASSASEVSKTWNNGTGNWTTTGFTSTTDGPGSTAGLVALSDAGSPYKAAAYCAGLSADGYSSGWYLPAKDELNLFWHGSTPIAGVNTTSGGWYWSSTEGNNGNAWVQRFSDSVQHNVFKNGSYLVRCVRR